MFCVGLYILFCWSCTPVHSQLVFCMHFCVGRCIPDVSVERDVFHVQQLLLPSCSSWARFVRVPWTARSNQSILKHITPAYSLEGLMLRLKLQYFGDLMWRTDSLEKIPMLGKTEGRKRRGLQRMKWLASHTQGTWVWASSGNRWCTGKPGVLQSMGLQIVGHDWATELTAWLNMGECTLPAYMFSHLAVSNSLRLYVL